MSYVDPRTNPTPPWRGRSRPPAASPTDVAPLIEALTAGRLYDAEAWIAAGKPLQFEFSANRQVTPKTPLQAAVWDGGHHAVLLLLCNGYRMELERRSPLTAALKAERHDVVRLLLAWGADAKAADAREVADSYDASLMEQFWQLGLDFGRDKGLASAVAHTTSNRPLYGFLRRHAARDPALQRELDRGLYFAVQRERRDGEVDSIKKAVNMCIWAGADPWSCVESPFGDESADDEHWFPLRSAAGFAVFNGAAELIPALKLRPDAPHFQDLYRHVADTSTYDALARVAPPKDLDALAATYLERVARTASFGRFPSTTVLSHVLEKGGRVRTVSDETCRWLRAYLRKAVDFGGHLIIRLLQTSDRVDRTVFLRMIASPKIIESRRDLGISFASLRELVGWPDVPPPARTAARRVLRAARQPGFCS